MPKAVYRSGCRDKHNCPRGVGAYEKLKTASQSPIKAVSDFEFIRRKVSLLTSPRITPPAHHHGREPPRWIDIEVSNSKSDLQDH